MSEYEVDSIEPIGTSTIPGKYIYRITVTFMGAQSSYTTHQKGMDDAKAEAERTRARLTKNGLGGGKRW